MESVLTAVISGLCVAIPSIFTTLKSSKANNELMEYKINDLKEDVKVLSDKVQAHNSFGIRLTKVEENMNSIKEEINDLKRK